ncbi:unnamed protein product [Heligmosomoides polygyrus]|uniref:Endo/exonuclease/phosphatase domain-containing protein n=1 Tax=Heligmosomoides polygyrus TaxID=6339 RepID=A0A183FGM8_HELPZ|nr:unnamed protein product [Heligmosomoides polygyrus]
MWETRWSCRKSRDIGSGLSFGIIVSERFRDSIVSAERFDDRLMKIFVATKERLYHFFSAYAPQSGCSDQTKDEFWNLLDEKTAEVPSKDVIIVAGDLNGHRGAARESGNYQLTPELAKLCRAAIKEDLKERRAEVAGRLAGWLKQQRQASRGGERSGRWDKTTTAAGSTEDDSGGEDPKDCELEGNSEGSTIDSLSRDTVIHSFARTVSMAEQLSVASNAEIPQVAAILQHSAMVSSQYWVFFAVCSGEWILIGPYSR